jgi:hypothetical protein
MQFLKEFVDMTVFRITYNCFLINSTIQLLTSLYKQVRNSDNFCF